MCKANILIMTMLSLITSAVYFICCWCWNFLSEDLFSPIWYTVLCLWFCIARPRSSKKNIYKETYTTTYKYLWPINTVLREPHTYYEVYANVSSEKNYLTLATSIPSFLVNILFSINWVADLWNLRPRVRSRFYLTKQGFNVSVGLNKFWLMIIFTELNWKKKPQRKQKKQKSDIILE